MGMTCDMGVGTRLKMVKTRWQLKVEVRGMKMGIQGENVESQGIPTLDFVLTCDSEFPFLLSLTNEHVVSV